MKSIKKLEVNFSLIVHRVVEVQEDNVDIAGGLPSLISLLVGWLRAKISRLFWAKLRDVLLQNSIVVNR